MNAGWSAPRFPTGGSSTDAHPLESLALWVLGAFLCAGGLIWTAGEVSGRLFGGGWPSAGLSDMGSVIAQFPHHLGDPASAWPEGASALIPGPVAFYGTGGAIVLPTVVILVLLRTSPWARESNGANTARWARPRDLRLLRVNHSDSGRLTLGRVDGRLVAAEPRQSVIVIGPTQTGKTTGFAIPAILEWQGPVVATSVKTDLLRETLAARQSLPGASTWVYDPTWSTGLQGAGWNPLMRCLSWQGAQRVAEWLVRAARPGGTTLADADFWYSAAAKVLAPTLLAAACSGGTMWEVVRWIDAQETDAVRFALDANDELEALEALQAPSRWDERTRGSVYATAQTVLIAYADPGVLASAMSAELRADRLLDGSRHTAYLCAPAHEQRRLQPLFATLVQEIVAHAYERAAETGRPLDPPLLLVLDECANIAPLRDLDTLASTGAGQGIQLVSVFQDMAQIDAVYGRDRAPTIVSNHRAKVILSGIADPPTLEYVARLLGDENVRHVSTTSGAEGRHSTTESVAYRRIAPANVLREMQPGHGVLVYGHLAPARIALRPWFKDRQLRRLATRPARHMEGALP
ncbi:MAG: type IV secretory system conjugative DNA transfer family protein [Actinomycetota bacterium]|nr:type IV secretory system conjugative DNA transfer family protein [Actinomycetota bacterium]